MTDGREPAGTDAYIGIRYFEDNKWRREWLVDLTEVTQLGCGTDLTDRLYCLHVLFYTEPLANDLTQKRKHQLNRKETNPYGQDKGTDDQYLCQVIWL